MGREVRMVTKNWVHPLNDNGRLKPLLPNYNDKLAKFMDMTNNKGLQEALDYFGVAPNKDDYMPEWDDSEKNYYMMYENTSEGTPISPAFASAEELAQWLVDNNASAFARHTAKYEDWLKS